MSATEGQQRWWPIQARWEDGDEVGDFDGGLALFGARARQLGDMSDPRPAGFCERSPSENSRGSCASGPAHAADPPSRLAGTERRDRQSKEPDRLGGWVRCL